MNDAVITMQNLVKYFDGRCVLDEINLNVPKGCIYGLLGRNGAGKTTIIRILLGLDTATRGTTKLLGCDSQRLSAQVKVRIGYVAESHNMIQHYKVGKVVNLCRGLCENWNNEFFNHLLETFRLPMERKINQLSNGMRAQLNLAMAMASEQRKCERKPPGRLGG